MELETFLIPFYNVCEDFKIAAKSKTKLHYISSFQDEAQKKQCTKKTKTAAVSVECLSEVYH